MMRFSLTASLKIDLDPSAPEPLRRAAADLVQDLHAVTGRSFDLAGPPSTENAVVIRIIPDKFPSDAWENYHVYADGGNVLRIEGSDMRGAIYGIYEFSRRFLHVPADHLWNLLSPRRLTETFWDGIDFAAGNPDIRYRGIFINDEDLLTGWEIGGKRDIDYPYYQTVISRGTAEKIAETTVRMGYNLAIPASFADIRNPEEEMLLDVFSKRGLILSMHHVEPLGVSAFGFDKYWKKRGQQRDYSYFRDPEAMLEVWSDSILRWKKYPEVIWQLGLRGRGDRPFWTEDDALKTDSERAALIGNAVRRQYELVRSLTGDPEPVCSTTLWGEGSLFNRKGILPVPKEVIKVFSDNCAGWRLQEDFHESPVIPGERAGVYCHHAVIIGTHLAQAIGPADFHAVLKSANAVRPLDYAIFNVANVREFVLGMTATAEMTRGLAAFSASDFLSGWVRDHFSNLHPQIMQCYQEYFAAFEKNPRGAAYYNDGLLLAEIDAAVRQDRRTGHLDLTFLNSLRDMFASPGPLEEKLAVIGRMDQAMTRVAEQAREIRDRLPEDEKKFFYAQLLYPAELYRRLCSAAAAAIRAETALASDDKKHAAEHFRSALSSLQSMEGLLPEYLSGPFEHWYDGWQKVSFRNAARQVEDRLKTILTN